MKTITTLRLAAIATAIAGLAVLGGTANAADEPHSLSGEGGELGPQHAITCGWDQGVVAPYSVGTDVVRGMVRVKCSDSLDKANTRAQLQVLDGGKWWNRGIGVTSYSTAKTIHVNDDSTKLSGVYMYRTVGTHYGQHGNAWALPVFYSKTQYLTG
ncbi:hypothetical protein OG625_07795 [Streptomyces sp. NBC_01351]|uniref:hypothetical protein n=1 Tax=Streptomyces sp. NBC_01351 TaxID=2903833 RepID=UPI002E355449|nr:hypothetical protein [Streptomyces sp. NBC_01351]